MKSFLAQAFLIVSLSAPLYAQQSAVPAQDTILRTQSAAVSAALKNETSTELKSELISVINSVDRIYGSLRSNVKDGKKVVIFFDPAHGMVQSGGQKEWQGALTWRKSTTGVPEELYSIPICRRMYSLLKANPNIDIASTPDFLEVMKGTSDVYDDVSFDTSVEYAKKNDAFLIISEHLNNISPIWKADGFINLEGLHITCNEWRSPMISYINGVYKGYYTYYNIFDVTGSSKSISDLFRENMKAKGYQPNGWDNGSVADDRFSIYINYPISFIFESGFISNPAEEAMLRTPEFQNAIVQSQYNAMLDTIKTEFGVDISGSSPVVDETAEKRAVENIEAIKLSRIFVFYTQKGEFAKALTALSSLEKQTADGSHKWIAWPYSELRRKIQRISGDLGSSAYYEKKRSYKKAGRLLGDAMQAMGYHPLFNNVRETVYGRYNGIAKLLGIRQQSYNYSIATREAFPPELQALRSQIETHSVKTPYLLTINQNESLEDAIDLSIAPSLDIRERVLKAFKNTYSTQTVYDKRYSKKKKKNIYTKRYVKVKAEFTPGIYLLTFGKNYDITWFSRVNNVPLDPKSYQNQQFFKNSCMAEKTRERAL